MPRVKKVIKESPDVFQHNNKQTAFTDNRSLCFILDLEGNGIVGKAMTHNNIQNILWMADESNEDEIFQIYTSTQYLKALSALDKIFYLRNGEKVAKEVMANMKLEANKELNVRFRLKEFAAGRVFPDAKGVSFWNSNNTLNSAQRHATVDILRMTNNNPDDFVYEVGPLEVKMSLHDFLTGGSSFTKRDKDPVFDLEKELHTMADPKAKQIIRKQITKSKGVPLHKTTKTPYPWEWKSKIRQESNMTNFKYYAFDWDDNLLHMPTKIIAEDISGNLVELSTTEYATIKENIYSGKLAVVREKVIKSFPAEAFENFRKDTFFLEEAKSAKFGPAWNDFVEAVNGGKIFSIITARGHSPSTFISTIDTFIKEGVGGLNYYSCIENLRDLREYSMSVNIKSDEELYENYISNLCKYYPIYHNADGDTILESVHTLKVNALHDFVEHVETAFNKFHPEFKNKVSNNFVIGFSDDDISNVTAISETNFKQPVEVYSTHSGIMQKITE